MTNWVQPVGVIQSFPLGATPGDHLECDGAAVERDSYPVLFAAIGTSWGAGDGTTTFNLPHIPRRTYAVPGADGTLSFATIITTIKAKP